MEAGFARYGEIEGGGEDGITEEALVGDRGVDARHVHADDAARAEVEMAYFGVSHLAVGESDEVLAGTDERVGIGGQKLVVGRLSREGDGVAVGLGAVTPAVEDGENDRFA